MLTEKCQDKNLQTLLHRSGNGMAFLETNWPHVSQPSDQHFDFWEFCSNFSLFIQVKGFAVIFIEIRLEIA